MTFTLLNTRPTQQAQSLNSEVVKAGGQSLACPTLEIVAKPDAFIKVKQELKAFKDEPIDKVIFISANAVQQFAEQNKNQALIKTSDKTQWFAIGRATAEMGKKWGYSLTQPSSSQFDSESFLASTKMQQVQNETVLLVKGVGGRTLLENTLQARGAKVVKAELYERCPMAFCKETWLKFVSQPQPVLLITSLASWDVLYASLSPVMKKGDNIMLNLASPLGNKNAAENANEFFPKQMLTVVMSQRIADHIQCQKWPYAIKVVTTQSNEGIINAIEGHVF